MTEFPAWMIRVAVAVLACTGLSGCIIYLNPLCTDQISNGDETDVDCGGPCGRCDIGDSCRSDSDCADSTCERGTCTPLPCANGVKDPQETDVDCGGGTCRPCAGARQCEVAGDCFSGTCVAGSKTCSSLTMVSFADAVSYPSGTKTYALFSGDVDGDGLVDLVAANELASTLSVFLNKGKNGGIQAHLNPVGTGDYPTGGAIADFNLDGIPDVITADYHGDSVSILFGISNGTGKGTGALAAKSSYATIANGETSNLAVGDLNKDTFLDVIATNPQTHSVSQLMGQAGGMLGPALDVPVGGTDSSEPFSAAIDDFNGDGNPDVAVAEDRSRTIIVRLGNGDGTFQPEVAYADGGVGAFILITHDMNLDHKVDLVCANRGSSDVTVLLGRGDGTFRKAIISSTGANTGPYSVAVADFNLDGVPDVVTANFMASTGTVLLGIGDGHLEAAINAGPTGDFSYGVAVGDFNGDNKPDFATANALSNDVTVKLSTAH